MVLSIAGDFRKGKSFFLNLLLRCLHSGGDEGWLSDGESPIKGFSWRGGSTRDTSGMLMWPDAFCFMHPSGEEVAIVLMDTQGAFDGEHNIGDTATVFALSFLTSSVQIFNLMKQIQEDNLQYLQILVEYGKLMTTESDRHKPFQKLLFLVRDWPKSYLDEYSFGFTGGQRYLNSKLESITKSDEQLKSVRDQIKHSFDDLACFLMPHPGLIVEEKQFNGKLSDIEPAFLAQVKKLASTLFKPENLVTKQVFGIQVTGNGLYHLIKSYLETYKNGTLPEPNSMFEATAEGHNRAVFAEAKQSYKKELDEICGYKTGHLNVEDLFAKLETAREEFLNKLNLIKELNGKNIIKTHLEDLKSWILRNEGKCKVINDNQWNWGDYIRAPLAPISGHIIGAIGWKFLKLYFL
jgi:atlastin